MNFFNMHVTLEFWTSYVCEQISLLHNSFCVEYLQITVTMYTIGPHVQQLDSLPTKGP
jgi:hypothetical protein